MSLCCEVAALYFPSTVHEVSPICYYISVQMFSLMCILHSTRGQKINLQIHKDAMTLDRAGCEMTLPGIQGECRGTTAAGRLRSKPNLHLCPQPPPGPLCVAPQCPPSASAVHHCLCPEERTRAMLFIGGT